MSARLADTLERCIPAILEEWGRTAANGELRALCDEDRVGDLASVLHAMSAALRPHAVSGAVDVFIETAAAHGARRRAQGVREACLFEEYDHLGTAVPHGLRACETAPLAPEDLVAGRRAHHRDPRRIARIPPRRVRAARHVGGRPRADGPRRGRVAGSGVRGSAGPLVRDDPGKRSLPGSSRFRTSGPR